MESKKEFVQKDWIKALWQHENLYNFDISFPLPFCRLPSHQKTLKNDILRNGIRITQTMLL